jgi:non-heme chloroperoxidase
MAFLPVGVENGGPIELYYEDHGEGRPVVLVHGWPMDGRMWERQVPALVDAGYRVIAYDRRGFGRSGRPWHGYDYDTLAGDLRTLLERLDLSDVTLVGFGMGGGEIVRHFGAHGPGRVAGIVLASAAAPFMYRSYDNPCGVLDDAAVAGVRAGITGDRIAFLDGFASRVFRGGSGVMVGEALRGYVRDLAALASPRATLECAVACMRTDLRADLSAITVPTLVVHGTRDAVVPFETTGARTHAAVAGSRLVLIEEAPHGCAVTHAGRFNRALLSFLSR